MLQWSHSFCAVDFVIGNAVSKCSSSFLQDFHVFGFGKQSQKKQMLQVQGANSLQDPEQQMEPRNGHRSVKQTCDPHNQSYSQIGF